MAHGLEKGLWNLLTLEYGLYLRDLNVTTGGRLFGGLYELMVSIPFLQSSSLYHTYPHIYRWLASLLVFSSAKLRTKRAWRTGVMGWQVRVCFVWVTQKLSVQVQRLAASQSLQFVLGVWVLQNHNPSETTSVLSSTHPHFLWRFSFFAHCPTQTSAPPPKEGPSNSDVFVGHQRR